MMLRYYSEYVVMVPKAMKVVLEKRFGGWIQNELEVAMINYLKRGIRLESEKIKEFGIIAIIKKQINKQLGYTFHRNSIIGMKIMDRFLQLR
mmetsp:Transcript_9170/g.13011  ORF Transcript_9170/g.13011 Transcript_9170/m.13011 type:complete len:92 (+) Transcript_9170:279-554(+)